MPSPIRVLPKLRWLTVVRRMCTRRFYDAFSQDYDTLAQSQPSAAVVRGFLNEYVAAHGITLGSLLETGCGTGLFSRQLVGGWLLT